MLVVYRQVNILLCSALAECIGTCGPALVEGRREAILGHVRAILEQRHECQQTGGLDDFADLETSEYEAVVISNSVEVLSAMASAYGPSFAEEFGNFFPLITKYYVSLSLIKSSSITHTDRYLAIYRAPSVPPTSDQWSSGPWARSLLVSREASLLLPRISWLCCQRLCKTRKLRSDRTRPLLPEP